MFLNLVVRGQFEIEINQLLECLDVGFNQLDQHLIQLKQINAQSKLEEFIDDLIVAFQVSTHQILSYEKISKINKHNLYLSLSLCTKAKKHNNNNNKLNSFKTNIYEN